MGDPRNLDDHERLDEGLKMAFGGATDSALQAIGRLTGTQPSQLLLRDAEEEASPILRVVGAKEPHAAADDRRYQIVGEIARGGMGVIYKARDRDLGRDVAVKVLRPDLANQAQVVQRFVEEAQVGGQLQHPGIVPVYGLGLQPDGRPYFAMKLIKGQTLAERMGRVKGASELMGVFEKVAQTVAYAHSRGVIHRDLKPSNVMVGAFGEVQVLDWGFAKVLGREESVPRPGTTMVATVRTGDEGSHSLAGSVMGTPAYMPPEQATGQIDALTERSDVFALGAVLCEILTGQPPYTGTSQDQLLAAMQGRLEEARARLATANVPEALKDLARACLEPLPKDRPKDAGVVAERVAAHLASVEERAQQAEVEAVRASAEAKRVERGRRAALLLASIVGLGLLGGAGGLYAWKSSERARAATSAAKVAPRLREATRLEGEGDWPAARAQARTALALAQAEGADQETLAAAQVLSARIEAAASAADAQAQKRAREDRLIDELDELWLMDVDLSAEELENGVRAAFVRFGVSPAGQDATAAFAGFGRPVELASHLDTWAAWRRQAKDERWGALDALARALDPDPWRTRLRDAASSPDPSTLRGLAALGDADEQPPMTLVKLAYLLMEAREIETALAVLRRGILRYPADVWMHRGLARILWSVLRRAREGLPHLEAAVALRPRSRGAWNNLGALRNDGLADHAGALRAFRMALELDPNGWCAHFNVGNALARCGDSDGAILEFREAIRLRPDYANIHINYGVVLRDKGDLDGAVAKLRDGLRISPDHLIGLKGLGVAFLMRREPDAAEAEFRKIIRLRPDLSAGHHGLGAALQDKGDLEGALAACRECIRIDPKSAYFHNRLGRVFVQAGDLDAAVQAHRRAVALEPGNTERASELANAELLAAARDRLPAVLRGEDTPATGEEWAVLAKLCYWTKDYATSARFYEKAFAANPRLADDLLASHRYDAACAAARAGGEWRERALAWLRADLGRRELQLDSDPKRVAGALRRWKADPDLVSVRDAADLPDAWKQLWADVDALLAKAEEQTK